MAKSLTIPGAVRRDPRSVEMLRAWIAEDDMLVVLNIGFWEEPPRGIDERDAWGIFMADLARHIANAHQEEYGRDPLESLTIIREAFEREIMKPTSAHSGHFARKDPPPTGRA